MEAKRFKIQHEGDRTTELLARFLASQGIPYEAISEAPIQDLIRHLKPDFQFPRPKELEKNQEGHAGGDYAKKREISVTFDVAGNGEQQFIVFTTHFLFNVRMKMNSVYLRRLEGTNHDPKFLVGFALSQIGNDPQFSRASIKNLVVPNEQTYNALQTAANKFICFSDMMRVFVNGVMALPEFSIAILELRTFVKTIRDNQDLVKKFQNLQMSSLSPLPLIGDGSWHSTASFLAKSLDMLPTLIKVFQSIGKEIRFDNSRLRILNNLLQECMKYIRELSRASGSISQVLPAFILLRRFITVNWIGKKEFSAKILPILNEQIEKLLTRKESFQYRIAMLLDPRFGYRDDLFTDETWLEWEGKVIEYIASNTSSPIETVASEMFAYRTLCLPLCPSGNSNPLVWWANNHKDFTTLLLATAAREYYTIPAVSIDAAYFFGKGGKFCHVSQLYEGRQLDDCLFSASCRQSFRGSGISYKITEPETYNSLLYYTRSVKKVRSPEMYKVLSLQFSENPNSGFSVAKEVKIEEVDFETQNPESGADSNGQEQQEVDYLNLNHNEKEEEEDRKPTLAELLKQRIEPEVARVEPPVLDMETRRANVSRLRNAVIRRCPPERLPPPIATTNVPYLGARRRRLPPSRLSKPPICALCNFKDPDVDLFHVVEMEYERLLTAHAAMRLTIIGQRRAVTAYKKNKLVVCRSHFTDLTNFIKRADLSERSCAEMEHDVAQVFGRQFCPYEYREWCEQYVEKFGSQTVDDSFGNEYQADSSMDYPGIAEEKPTDLLF